jgi:two-component system, chemotaxis family, chemotaxis protein CheY
MKFLIIDDSVPMRRIVQNVLARLGHTDVVCAANGREALKRVETEPIDFVITDWYMPEMNGLEFLRTLRRNESTRDVPIVIVTANASKKDVAQAVKLGVNAYVLKPFTAEFLRERIGAICDGLAGRAPQTAAPESEAEATPAS